MGSRLISPLLIGLLLVLHAQLWFGRGSVTQVASLKEQLAELDRNNREAQQRNDSLSAEVRDLQEGLDMVEELARQELGMVKPNEIFVQIAQGKR
ncbi:MAG: septum formation initiator family protein [Hydrogenophaga sp.]|uniref:septum formation initiator family protein n=1 Tax=Hydrogenophaga sp. TaxID=1904254 RepID=UPI00271AA215|nr:septum formation initiator family protein [Hydrogenophaga sp.]MDO9147551.1 septum formation initiator family protein [Hydrogenophaga sp.]MDO9606806.1 septum formation initiator family protein [Hydrogenophaga sp.]MDP2165417.1 septum formation initiator family protein [Hydrogenophaga sp.]MDP3477182.1 septum formation initiator family protein [Hydrogenophaga sp.]